MRNAQDELREEHVEIAIYTRIEALATAVGDRETAQLARSIRRDEERMAKFLDAELKRLVKALVRAEIPRDQRVDSGRSSGSSRAAGSRSRRTGAAASSRPGAAASSRPRAASSRSDDSRRSGSRTGSTSSRRASGRSRRSGASS